MTTTVTHAPLLPGIPVAGLPAAPLPHRLLAPGPLLLSGVTPGATVGLASHTGTWGPLPAVDITALSSAAERMGLHGAGGAGFPTWRKLRSLAHGPSGPVVVNGSEGETASGKDTVLLTHVPHLVLDGAVAAARALGSRQVVVRVPATRTGVIATVRNAISERRDDVAISVSPGEDRFIAGEATAVIASLQGQPALPTPQTKPPTMRAGLRKRPVLLSNVETFARLALAARGNSDTSALVTVSGAVMTAGVVEVPSTTTIGELFTRAGADADLAAVIIGGWHGTWLPATDATFDLPLERQALRRAGAHFGAGAFVAIPRRPCPVHVLTAIADYLLGAGAGQCAPCVLGLSAARRDLLEGQLVQDRVERRGLCAHPTATIAALQSGQQVLAGELAAHSHGYCEVER